MYTKFIADGKEHIIRTQQYGVGLYVIVNDDPNTQGCVNKKERDFHIRLRKAILKDENTIVEGSFIERKPKENWDLKIECRTDEEMV